MSIVNLQSVAAIDAEINRRAVDGADIRTVQELLGHKDVRTTMKYLHCMKKPGLAVKSPMDIMPDRAGHSYSEFR